MTSDECRMTNIEKKVKKGVFQIKRDQKRDIFLGNTFLRDNRGKRQNGERFRKRDISVVTPNPTPTPNPTRNPNPKPNPNPLLS